MLLLIKLGLLAIILLAIVLFLGYMFVTGKLKKFLTKVVTAAQPAHIHLIRDREVEWNDYPAVAAEVHALRAAGFRTITIFRIDELEDFKLVGLAHPEESLAAAVYEHEKAGVWVDIVADYENGGSLTVSSAPQGGEQASPPHHEKVYLKKSPVPRLMKALRKRLRDEARTAVGPANFAALVEKIYAEDAAWRLEQIGGDEEVETLERDPELDHRSEPLFAAIAAGRPQVVRMLLDADLEPEGRDARGRTPLIAAVAESDLELVQTLLDSGADVNARAPGNPGQAAQDRSLSMSDLAEQVDDPKAQTFLKGASALVGSGGPLELNNTALTTAIETGNPQVVAALLRAGADLAGPGDLTPLQFAAQQGDPEIVRALLAGDAPPDQPGEDDYTPLMAAAFEGFPEIVGILLDHGADAETKSGRDTAITLAAELGYREITDLLSPLVQLNYRKKATKLFAEAGEERIDVGAKRLLSAATHGVAPMVEKLLAGGLHPDTLERDDEDEDEAVTPLIMAAQGGHVKVLRALVAAGADVERPYGEETALGRAASLPAFMDPADQPRVIRILLAAGASQDPLDEEQRARVAELTAD